ncbi:MAG: hypothetical protein FD146_633 [Anaerolineaceae bacterium]|nr:MAG: hypothetical protein FD146_633 [Anaerolineaceae bacterium]
MKKSIVVFLGLLLALSACNMPGGVATEPPGIAYTRAAQTVEYELTRLAPTPLPPATNTPIVPPTNTSIPTSTTAPSATPIPIPCNRATYNPATIDVTIPDWTVISAGAAFTKTWRLTNNGTCTALTSGTVPPGGTVDISVTLTAPLTSGTFKGYWRLREPGGQYFGIGNTNGDFYVAITVAGDTLLTLNQVAGESGSVLSDGTVKPNVLHVGDTAANLGSQVFLSFDISSIPVGSTIKSVSFDYTVGGTTVGAPLTTLGCLYFYAHNYGTLDAADFTLAPPPGGLTKLCSLASLTVPITGDDDWTTAVQARVGTTRFQIRMQFPTVVSDMNATDDLVKLGTITLKITYKKP